MFQNKNDIASATTIKNLISIARVYFSQYGYDKTSLEAIVKEAGMTRGAVYHHYKNKRALFLAVLKQVQTEVGQHVEKCAMTSDDVWEQLILGCIGFVEAATKESNRRILLVDSLNVVDWDDWCKMDSESSVQLLIEQLQIVKEYGILIDLDIVLIAHLVSGALNELSLHIAESNPLCNEVIREYITHLLKGFKKNGY